MFKKYLCLALAVLTAASLTLAGCAKDDTSSVSDSSEVVSNQDVISDTSSEDADGATSSDLISDVLSEESSETSSDVSSETSSEVNSEASSEPVSDTSSSESRPPVSSEASSAVSSEVSSEASSEENADTSSEVSSETSSEENDVTAGKSCTSIYEAAIAGLDMPAMQVMDAAAGALGDTTLTDYFYLDLDTSKCADYCVATPFMMVHATEVAIFKPVDKAASKDIRAAIDARLEILENNWSNYLPEQYELVQNHQIVEENGYIMMVVSYFPDEIVKQFKNAVK